MHWTLGVVLCSCAVGEAEEGASPAFPCYSPVLAIREVGRVDMRVRGTAPLSRDRYSEG